MSESCELNLDDNIEKILSSNTWGERLLLNLKEDIKNIECTQSGGAPLTNAVWGGILATATSLVTLVFAALDVKTAYAAQCSLVSLAVNIMLQSNFCFSQNAALSAAIFHAATRATATLGLAAYTLREYRYSKFIEDIKKKAGRERLALPEGDPSEIDNMYALEYGKPRQIDGGRKLRGGRKSRGGRKTRGGRRTRGGRKTRGGLRRSKK